MRWRERLKKSSARKSRAEHVRHFRDPDFERNFGQKADRRRKLYNGNIQCQLYMYIAQSKTKERQIKQVRGALRPK
jgi:putative N6-adenine-specific DNA methylase